MRRMIGVGLVLLIVTQALSAQQPAVPAAKPGPQEERDSFSMFLGRFGFFLAGDSAFTDIYGNGVVFGGELRIGGKRIAGWLEGNYRARTGKSSFTEEETNVNVMAIEGGALYRIMPGNISPYVEAGIGYYMFDEKNSFIGEAKKSNVGFCGAAGVSVFVAKLLVLDCRLKYSTCSMKPADFDINVGGLTMGIGLGARF